MRFGVRVEEVAETAELVELSEFIESDLARPAVAVAAAVRMVQMRGKLATVEFWLTKYVEELVLCGVFLLLFHITVHRRRAASFRHD